MKKGGTDDVREKYFLKKVKFLEVYRLLGHLPFYFANKLNKIGGSYGYRMYSLVFGLPVDNCHGGLYSALVVHTFDCR